MTLDILIFVAFVSGVTLIWRTLNDDHPKLKSFVQSLPYIGEPLSCGVCTSYWFTLFTLFIFDPLSFWTPALAFPNSMLTTLLILGVKWFALGTAVLFLRSSVIVSLEGSAVLKHQHHRGHQEEQK